MREGKDNEGREGKENERGKIRKRKTREKI